MRRRLAAAAALSLLASPALDGQEAAFERLPAVPGGVPVVVFPVQSAVPAAGGTWVGGAGSGRGTIELLDAELAFAFGEEEGAGHWALGSTVAARLGRNPTIDVDPRRLAYHGLLEAPDPGRQLYEPLHSQLRRAAALFGARVAVLPLSVSYREPAGPAPAVGRAVLLVAVIDVRRSAVLWHGTIEGGVADAASPSALTTLALRVADQLAPSRP